LPTPSSCTLWIPLQSCLALFPTIAIGNPPQLLVVSSVLVNAHVTAPYTSIFFKYTLNIVLYMFIPLTYS
jgi:hypothetical protein